MVRDLDSGVVELRVKPGVDPHGDWLARAVNAAFAVEVATRRRRAWTAAMAAMSIPATLALVFPGLLTPSLRRTDAAAWSVAVVALVAHVVAEVRAARTVRHLRKVLGQGQGGPRSVGGGMG